MGKSTRKFLRNKAKKIIKYGNPYSPEDVAVSGELVEQTLNATYARRHKNYGQQSKMSMMMKSLSQAQNDDVASTEVEITEEDKSSEN